MAELGKIREYIKNSRKEMIDLQTLLSSIPAIAPESGGEGEYDKAQALIEWLKKNGFTDIQVLNAKDERAKNGVRPNIIVTIPGESDDYARWIMAHMDVVPPGDLSAWNSDPYKVI